MSKNAKKWLIVATALVVVGLAMFLIVTAINGWDFSKLSTAKYQTNIYEFEQDISDISIDTESADIVFSKSSDEKIRVVCYEKSNLKNIASIDGETLKIASENNLKWYEYLYNFGGDKVTIQLPKTEYCSLLVKAETGDIKVSSEFKFDDINIAVSTGKVEVLSSANNLCKIKTTTGEIIVKNSSASALDLSVSTGEITVSDFACTGDASVKVSTGDAKLTNFSCNNFSSSGSTGSVLLKNFIASGVISVTRSTGSVRFEKSDGAEIIVKTDTGSVTGSLLTEKIFIVRTDAGSVSVPSSVSGGRCEIETDTGNIKITIE